MSKMCDLTGKIRQVGNRVSHSNIKTKTINLANLKTKKIYDPETGKTHRLKLSTRAIKTLDKNGSISKFLRKEFKKGSLSF